MAKRIYKKLTPEEAAEYRRIVAEEMKHKDENITRGRIYKAEHDQMLSDLADVFSQLRAERERQGLSLADIQDKTGMSRESICRLENLQKGNFNIETVRRYAKALGMKVKVTLVGA